MTVKMRATVADLERVPENGKAELVGGELVLMPPTGAVPGRASSRIWQSLDEYEDRTGHGYAIPDNVGFLVDLPNRESFSPNAAFWIGPEPTVNFLNGSPIFAVEVRSDGDYRPSAERQITQKIADYFAAGTQVVWDVDLLGPDVVRSYQTPNAQIPARVFRRGETADAGPALPGWSLPVEQLFPHQNRIVP